MTLPLGCLRLGCVREQGWWWGWSGMTFLWVGRQTGSLVVVAKTGRDVLSSSAGSGYGPVRGVGRFCFPYSENSGKWIWLLFLCVQL